MGESRGARVEVACDCCGAMFTARVADRKRGWARFCSKRCKAIEQEQRTGQHAAFKAIYADDTHPFSEDAFEEYHHG